MRRLLLLPVFLLAAAMPASSVSAFPYTSETNPIGTLQWIPDNANERSSVPSGQHRLVVTYDRSLNSSGGPTSLIGRGPFGVKFTTTSPDPLMMAHSAHVSSIHDAAVENGAPDPLLDAAASADQHFMGVTGDLRDGKCSLVGTEDFSQAFSTTRTFFHAGATAYKALATGGACEVVESSEPATQDGVSGFATTVTNHVPGFWIDIVWPQRTDPLSERDGYFLSELWYTAMYDDDGEDGEFYETRDGAGTSQSLGDPLEHDIRLSFTAAPGGVGVECTDYASGQRGIDGTWDDEKIEFPEAGKKVSFRLFAKGDWDLVILDPDGAGTVSGKWAGFHEEVHVSSIREGTYVMRACNFSGEPTVFGAVDID